MSVLVQVREGAARASSLVVAEKFDKRHDHVLRAITVLLKGRSDLAPNFGGMVQTVHIGSGASRASRYYEMDRKGFMLLVMGFTGAAALDWKIRFIDEFDRMEAMLAARANDDAAALPVVEESPVFAQIRGEDFDRKLSLAREIRLAYGRGAVRRMWNAIGLPPVEPDAEAEESADIPDDVAGWLNERTERAPGHRVSMQALFHDYQGWIVQRGEDPRSAASLGKALVRAGFPARKSSGAFRSGLRLIG